MTADCHPGDPTRRVTMPAADLRGKFFIFICSARHPASRVPLRCAASLLLTPFSRFQMHSRNPGFFDMGNYSPRGFRN